jgi:hypothetical protein
MTTTQETAKKEKESIEKQAGTKPSAMRHANAE